MWVVRRKYKSYRKRFLGIDGAVRGRKTTRVDFGFIIKNRDSWNQLNKVNIMYKNLQLLNI